jgi:hypothetical protein
MSKGEHRIQQKVHTILKIILIQNYTNPYAKIENRGSEHRSLHRRGL